MKSSSTIVIVSNNGDFTSELAGILVQDFAADCKINEDPPNYDLLITDNELDAETQNVIAVKLPVSLRSLLAEIEQKLNNIKRNDILFVAENIKFSLQNKVLSGGNMVSVDLTDKETQLLQSIIEAGEGGIARETMLKNIWGIENELDTHTLETHIYRLRKKIKDTFGCEMIKASDGGYRL